MAHGSQVLRQLGPHWLECLDEYGIFYFNQVTQQSSETFPAELASGRGPALAGMSAPAPQFQPPISSYTPPQSYMPAPQLHPQMPSYTPPQSYAPQLPPQMPSYTPPQLPPQMPSYTPPQSYTPGVVYQHQPQIQGIPAPQIQAFPQAFPPAYPPHPSHQQHQQKPVHVQVMPAQQPATEKMLFGEWGVYEDHLGVFYLHVPSGQQFEAPPPELMVAYQQYRSERDQIYQQQLQEIEMQKQQIDQRLLQQTQALQQRPSLVPSYA